MCQLLLQTSAILWRDKAEGALILGNLPSGGETRPAGRGGRASSEDSAKLGGLVLLGFLPASCLVFQASRCLLPSLNISREASLWLQPYSPPTSPLGRPPQLYFPLSPPPGRPPCAPASQPPHNSRSSNMSSPNARLALPPSFFLPVGSSSAVFRLSHSFSTLDARQRL